MQPAKGLAYLLNCFWLLVPILAFNLIFTPSLPRDYQMAAFWKDIPAAVGAPENVLRVLVFLAPLIMRLRLSGPAERLGLALYLAGTLVYFASWWALIASPESACSRSALGFMAPAYTPILFLVGIGLVGKVLFVPGVPYRPWMYWGLSGLFLLFHNLHAGMVYARSH